MIRLKKVVMLAEHSLQLFFVRQEPLFDVIQGHETIRRSSEGDAVDTIPRHDLSGRSVVQYRYRYRYG